MLSLSDEQAIFNIDGENDESDSGKDYREECENAISGLAEEWSATDHDPPYAQRAGKHIRLLCAISLDQNKNQKIFKLLNAR